MSKVLLLTFLLISFTNASYTLNKDNNIDAGPIEHWRENWAVAPIEVSYPHASASVSVNVYLTFNIRITTALAADNIVEIHFPPSYSNSPNPYTETLTSAKAAGSEFSVRVLASSGTPSSAGAYGPFKVYTRKNTGGQIIDMTNAFGSVYFEASIGTAATLNAQLATGTGVGIATETNLSFSFTATNDIWSHDVFVIGIDSKWSIEKPTLSGRCRSKVDTGVTNYLVANDTVTSGTENVLQCAVDAENRFIYVYGVYQEVDVNVSGTNNQLAITLLIDSIKSPDRDYADSDYKWSVYQYRLFTPVVVDYWTDTGIRTNPGSLSISWTPHNGYSISEIVQGLTMYMDITITPAHAIPTTGVINLTFSSIDIEAPRYIFPDTQVASDDTNYCYVAQSSNYSVTCGVTDATHLVLTIGGSGVASQTAVTVTALVNFTAASPNVSATSKIGNYEIDTTSTQATVSYAQSANVLAATSYSIFFTSSSDTTSDTPSNTTGTQEDAIVVGYSLVSSGTVSSGNVTISVKGPWGYANNSSNQAVSYNNYVWIDSTTNYFKGNFVVGASVDATNTDIGGGSAITTLTAQGASGSSLGTITATYDQGTNRQGAMALTIDSSGVSVDVFSLPKVATNLYTRYETWFSAQITGQTVKYNQFAQIGFVANDFQAKQLSRQCFNFLTIDIQTSFTSTAASGETYYIELDFASFDSRLGSNLAVGDAYGAQFNSNFSSGVAATLISDKVLRISGQSTMDSNNHYIIYTAANNANASIVITWYFMSSDSSEKQILSQGTSNAPAAGTTSSTDSLATNTNYSVNVSNASYESADLGTSSSTYFFQFPAGFSVENATLSVTDAGTGETLTNPRKLSITGNRWWAFPTIMADGQCAGACIATVTGVQVSPYAQTTYSVYSSSATVCDLDDTLNITGGVMTVAASASATVESRGPDGYHSSLTVTLTPATAIPGPVSSHTTPGGGQITAQLTTNWQICAETTCTVSGLTATSADSQICNLNAAENQLTLSNFNAVTASTTISITLGKVLPPENTSGSSASYNVLQSASSSYSTNPTGATALTGTIDTASDFAPTAVSVNTRTNRTTTTTVKQLTTIPNNVSAQDVDLYLRFTLSKKVPAKTLLTISAPSGMSWAPTTDLKNYVFLSVEYTSVTKNGSELKITLKTEVASGVDIELYVEEAFDNPTADASSFRIKTEYTCNAVPVILDDDSTLASGITLSSSHTLTVKTGSGNSIGSAAITQNINNAGLPSDYTFTFQTDSTTAPTDYFLIKFPRVYDEYVTGQWPTENFIRYQQLQSSRYYVECSSSDLGSNVECTVDHRMVKVFNVGQLDQAQTISITINSVINPQESNTNTVFKIYQMDENDSIKAKNENVTGPTIGDLAQNIKIQSVTVSNTSTFGTGDNTFKVFLPGLPITSNNTLDVILPRQYNTDLSRGQSTSQTTQCSITYYDVTDNVSDLTDTNTNNGTSITGLSTCSVSDNLIEAVFDSGDSTTFNDSYRIDFTINSLNNPQWGFSRSKTSDPTGNYDAWDSTAFTLYKQWTNQLRVGFYNSGSNDQRYEAVSYENVNCSYLGFSPKYRGFTVNNYNPINRDDHIFIQRGTQSRPLTISTKRGVSDPLGANKVVLAASLNNFKLSDGSLTFSSIYQNWTIFDTEYQLQFRVGASASSDLGVYYINWTVTETSYDGASSTAYDPPVRTLVEVNNVNNQVSFTLRPSSALRAQIGMASIPVELYIANPPAVDLTVNLTLNAELPAQQVTLNTSTLIFGPDIESRYFTITVASGYDTSVNPSTGTVSFTFSGTNANSYANISDFSFTIEQPSSTTTVSAPSLSHTDPNKTSVKITGTSTQIGVYYNYCGPQNDAVLSGEELESRLGDPFDLQTQTITTTGWTRADLEVEPTDSDTNAYTSKWAAFQYRLLKKHLLDSVGSAVVNYDSQDKTLFELDELWAGLTYTCYSYIKYNGVFSSVTSLTFTTDPLPDTQTFEMSFNGAVDVGRVTDLGKYAANVLGINPHRFLNGLGTQTNNNNEVSKTTFKWDVPPVYYRENPDPSDQLKLDEDQTSALKALVAQVTTLTPSFSNYEFNTDGWRTPQWVTGLEPSLSSSQTTKNQIAATMTCNTTGFICGICTLPVAGKYPNHYQILAGVDAENIDNQTNNDSNNVFKNCAVQETSSVQNTLIISGLKAETTYSCYYQCFNTYPINPWFVAYTAGTSDNAIRSISTTTPADTNEDDSAAYLRMLVIALLALLV